MISGCNDNEFPRPAIQLPGGVEFEVAPRICIPTIEDDSDSGIPIPRVCGPGGRINIPLGFSVSQSLAVFSASRAAVDVSASNVGIPVQFVLTVSLRNSSGALITSQSFSAVRSGGLIRASDPAAVDAWLLANGSNATVVDAVLDAFPVQEIAGETASSILRLWMGRRSAQPARFGPIPARVRMIRSKVK